jgi:hypothetical protein
MRPHERVVFGELARVIVWRGEGEIELVRKDGRKTRVPMGDLVRAALPEIEEATKAHGVVVGEVE